MDWKEQIGEFNSKVGDLAEQAKEYFSNLDDEEQYGWAAEGAGFIILIAGIVKLIL